MAKRLFDTIFALLGLVLTLPLFAVIALLIKRDSEGPVFYRAPRVGKDGKPFKMLKFRTMVANADKIGGPSTANDDPRITRIGRFLRRYKLDELPQLINVLKGEMSFVGPRPEVQQYVDMYTDEERAILSVKPGITDWASLWNSDEGAVLAGSPDPEKTYLELIRPTKVKLQLEYVRKRSFLTDLEILLRTVMAVVCRSTSPAVSELGGSDGSTRSGNQGGEP
ncbi:MAG: sugar transferase [Armatimonadota bacterium]